MWPRLSLMFELFSLPRGIYSKCYTHFSGTRNWCPRPPITPQAEFPHSFHMSVSLCHRLIPDSLVRRPVHWGSMKNLEYYAISHSKTSVNCKLPTQLNIQDKCAYNFLLEVNTFQKNISKWLSCLHGRPHNVNMELGGGYTGTFLLKISLS